MKSRTTLRIPLLDIQSYPPVAMDTQTGDEPVTVVATDTQTNEPVTVVLQSSTDPISETPIALANAETSSVPIDENPFTLTDAEVSDVLKGLEETFTPEEVDRLLRGVEETLDEDRLNADHYIDAEVERMMSMTTEDFIV